MSRNGTPQIDWIGMGRNDSLGRPPLPYFSVRLMHMGHIGKMFVDYYGGTMMWDELGSLRIPWGYNETIKYNGVQPGWTYWWEIGTWDFIVTDDLGNVTTEKIKTLSDLGITWDILESHQFSIHITGKFENDAFLIAWKYKHGYDDPDDPDGTDNRLSEMLPYLWGQFEKYLNDLYTLHLGRLLNTDRTVGENQLVSIDITTQIRSAIFAKVTDLRASGEFPNDLVGVEESMSCEIVKRIREAESYMVGSLLMIRLFASISDNSDPVFEPWMLWQIWQWFGRSSVVVSRDRVFDLSPWWG